jgi:hypothetical protein
MRKDPDDGIVKPYVKITETRQRVRYVSMEKIQARRIEAQRMLDAEE